MESNDSAISCTVCVAAPTCSACVSADLASFEVELRVAMAEPATSWAVNLIPMTSSRSCSMAKLTASAIAPVMSSVTVAWTVRSPLARELISSSSFRIASWCCLLPLAAIFARRRSAERNENTSIHTIDTITARPITAAVKDGHNRVFGNSAMVFLRLAA